MPYNVLNDIWITQVEAINFQSLKHVLVKLINGTNAFIGESNSGKTAMIRAIIWCLRNTPSGDHFITVGEKETIVRVSLSNGKMIERRKSASVNMYSLFSEGELVEEYTGFGRSVPEEIVEAHGIRPISGDIYFQFALQLETAFLVSLPPSKRASVLGNMDELKRIDTGLTEINEDIRTNTKNEKELKKASKHLNKDIKRIKLETERAKKSIETLKVLKEGLEKKMSMRDYLLRHIKRLREIQSMTKRIEEDLEQSERILKHWPTDFDERFDRYKNMSRLIQRLNEIKQEVDAIQLMDEDNLEQLAQLKDEIETKYAAFQQLNQSVKRLKEIEMGREEAEKGLSPGIASMDLEPLEKQLGKYKLLFSHIERLREIDKSREETKKASEQAKLKIDTSLDKLVLAIKEAEICPTCGQETHGVCSESIEETVV